MEGCYEQLKQRIEELRENSTDPMFTEYLLKLNNRLIQEKHELDLLRVELDRSYQLYLKRTKQVAVTEEVQSREVPDGQNVSDVETGLAPEDVQSVINAAPQVQAVSFAEVPGYGQSQTAQLPLRHVKKKKDSEFTIGIGVFSFVGVFFVLAAFVMLGMYFMNGFVKGMLLYVMAVAVWLVSELLVRKRSHVLSVTLSSIGIAGLYISTLVNYLYLQNFNESVAGIVLVAVTFIVFLANRKKSLGIIQMASVAISTWVLMLNDTIPNGTALANREIYLVVYFVLSMLLIEAILYRLSKVQGTNVLLYIVYGFSIATCAIGCNSVMNYHENAGLIRMVILAVVVVMGALFYFLLRKENKVKWTQLFFVYGTALLLFAFRKASVPLAAVIILLLLFVKLLPPNVPVKICNISVTGIAAIFAMSNSGTLPGYLVLGAMLISILCIRYWHTCYEAIITFTAVLIVILEMESILVLPIILAVLWLGVVLFNQVERFRGSSVLVYNVMVLICATLCFMWVVVEDYSELKIMYLILTMLGLGIIAFVFQERNQMSGARGMVIVSFLTYMILVSRFTYDVTSSIMLLLLGLGSIGTGFGLTDKKLRVYGLVLSMIVCFKITLFDFRGEDTLQKMLLFLAAGVVSLIISGIYIILDKKYNK